MEISKIIDDLKAGKLNRNIDEKYANGFWDLAGELAENETQQENIYNAFYEIAECCLNADFDVKE